MKTTIPLRTTFLFFALAVTVVAWPFRARLCNPVFEWGTLSNDSPPVELVNDMVELSPHREAAILSAWQTGRLVHRRAAIFEVRVIVASTPSLSPELARMVLAAAFDPDLTVREDAFRVLRRCNRPELGTLAASQLHDSDPEIRLLGLDYLRWISSDRGIPTVAPVLDDADPLVDAYATCLLGKWAHQDFGIKLIEVAPGAVGEKSGLRDLRSRGQEKSKVAASRAKAWWDAHRSQFAGAELAPVAPDAGTQPVIATDFEASTLDGRTLHLTDLRGKAVLLYFWTSPCPGARGELQDLIAVQNKHQNDLTVVGVSLDNVHDDDGDLGGDDDNGDKRRKPSSEPLLADIRAKVARLINDFGVKYEVIIDPDFSIGGKFNAIEMPTTVIIDAQGFVRRRFTGRRTLPVLEAMVAEASRPVMYPAKL